MFKKSKKYLLVLILLLCTTAMNAGINGLLFDQYGGIVTGAEIEIYNLSDDVLLASLETNANGYFSSEMSDPSLVLSRLLLPYPNPSLGETVIPFYLIAAGDAQIDIFNIKGQRVQTINRSFAQAGVQQIVWNSRDSYGLPVPAGIYIVRLQAEDNTTTAKLTLLGYTGTTAIPADISFILDQHVATQFYNFVITLQDSSVIHLENKEFSFTDTNRFYINRNVELPFIAQGEFIQMRQNDTYKSIFLKGVNMGVATPGTQPGQMAATREEYHQWIRDLADAGLNYIRTYTLHYPRFYEELALYNNAYPENPVFLIQGVWLDEEYEDDLFTETDKFKTDIEETINCMHGNQMIDHRYGRAYGDYTVNVNPWLLGYIIGREIYPSEVILAEVINSDYHDHDGISMSIHNSLPIDAWVTQILDHLVTYEKNTYNSQRPVSVSSWPTLDPISHPTEDPERTEEDIAVLDMADIECHDAPAGFFMSYHAYPYYPDFISEDPGYQMYSDEEGPNSYLGYLHDLNDHYVDIPLFIAEYGVPSSWGNAHFSFSGMHHGGFSEREQGESDVRLLKNIHSAGCAGGMLFSWIDEWFKNSWITEPMASTTTRRPLWHNVTSAEENYGMIGFKEAEPDYTLWPESPGSGNLSKLETDMDNAYFYAKIHLENALSATDTIWVAFDTYRADLGESVLPNGSTISNRAEFVIAVNRSAISPMFVTHTYDLFGIWFNESEPGQLYHSIATDGGAWNLIRWKNNRNEWSYQEIGLLRTALPGDTLSSIDGVRIDPNSIELRIPWTLLQVTDPSSAEVMDDDRSTFEREVSTTDGICLTVIYGNDQIISDRLTWNTWDVVPNLIEYEKASHQVFIDGARTVPAVP